jgi:hypothetical protein
MKQLIDPDFKTRDMPIELRAIRQYESADQDALLTKLIVKRIAYTNGLRTPIVFPIRDISIWDSSDLAQAVHFFVYASEMGENPKDYESLLELPVQHVLSRGEIQKFFAGKISWRNAVHREILENFLVKDFRLSPWLEDHFKMVLANKKMPRAIAKEIVESLEKTAKDDSESVSKVKEMLEFAKKSRPFKGLIQDAAEVTPMDAVTRTPNHSLREKIRCMTGDLMKKVGF